MTPEAKRTVRMQAAILQDHCVLLLRVDLPDEDETFWVIPGGGQEPDEDDKACVRREVMEETHLTVTVDRVLFEDRAPVGDLYQSLRTYLCHVVDGEARPGIEPEVDDADHTTIAEVRWFDLRDPDSWDPLVDGDPYTYPQLQRLRRELGYLESGED